MVAIMDDGSIMAACAAAVLLNTSVVFSGDVLSLKFALA
jgi:hypothetical protein